MKKQITTVAIAISLGLFTANAQDLTSKKGEPILPEEGDWGLGIDATPFLNYFGNFFGKTSSNTAPSWNFLTSNQTITGKYFKDATTAYRAALRIGLGSTKKSVMTSDRSASAPSFPTTMYQKENTGKYAQTNIGLSGGIEMRKGKTRLQGFYGGEVGIFFGSNKTTYTYGNALNPTASTPVDVDASGDNVDGTNVVSVATPIVYGQTDDARITQIKTSGIFQFGIRGFIGAEYFVLPKISIGGEFGWGIGFGNNGKTTTTYEVEGIPTGGTQKQSTTVQVESKNGSGFILDTDNRNSFFGPSANLRLNLYF